MRKTMVIAAAVFLIAFINVSSPAKGKKSAASFYGEVVNFTGEYVELKKGKKEMVLYFTDKTVFVSGSEEKAGKELLQPCQMARGYYRVSGGKKELIKLVIVKKGRCP